MLHQKDEADKKKGMPCISKYSLTLPLMILTLLFLLSATGCTISNVSGPTESGLSSPAAAGPTDSSGAETTGPSPTDNPDAVSGATKSRFRTGEVQNYQGKNLSPAIGPSDNSISGVQKVDMTKYVLTIDGAVDAAQSLKYDDVIALPPYQRLITLHCVTGWDATILWKGVLLDDLIAKAGAKASAVTVIFHAADGYTTSLPLATIHEKQLILAYSSNGLDLPPEMGYPFIVVAEEKFGYKWARWVTRIELSEDANYQGYWEQRGYDNTADIGK